MKLPGVLLGICLVAVIGSAVANEEGAAKSGTAERVCPLGIDNDSPLLRKISTFMRSCGYGLVGPTNIMAGNDTSIGTIQTYFDKMCELRVPTFIECIAEKKANLEVCEDPMTLKLFTIMRDTVLNYVESGCAEGAKRFVTLVHGLKSNPDIETNSKDVEMCMKKRFAIMNAIQETNSDISSKLYVLHKQFTKMFDCVKTFEWEPPMREVIEYLTNQITNNMKCIHPIDGTLVPCISISHDSVTACCICKMKSHDNNMEMYDILERDSGKCFDNIIPLDMQEKNTITDNEAMRQYIKNVCTSKRAVTSCLGTSKFISEDCLNGTLKREFELLISSINNGLEVACLEDGKRVADIMFEVYRLKNAGQVHAVWDCVAVAKSTRNELDEHRSSSKNMRFYHEMDTFKQCLANQLHSDQTSVAAVTSLMPDLLNKVECVSAEDGSTVLCETLMQNNHHHHHNHH